MSLPPSLGKPGVSAEQLLAESRALKEPFGVPVLELQPEEFAGHASDAAALDVQLGNKIAEFFWDASKGDPQKKADPYRYYEAEGWHIPYRAQVAANHPDYTDSHAAYLRENENTPPVAGIILAQRQNVSVADFAANMTGIDKSQLEPVPMTDAEARLLTRWHESAHCAGANEPQADKMGSLVFRQAFPDLPGLQAYADLRAIDTVMSAIKYPHRLGRYGWATVEAVDAVSAMPAEQVRSMDEAAIKETLGTSFDFKEGAMLRLGAALKKQDAGAFENNDIRRIGEALATLVKQDEFARDPEVNQIAARSLQAIRRQAVGGPSIGAALDGTAQEGSQSKFGLLPVADAAAGSRFLPQSVPLLAAPASDAPAQAASRDTPAPRRTTPGLGA